MIKIIEDIDSASLKRSVDAGTEEQRQAVQHIIEQVKREGDQAVRAFTSQYDQVKLTDMLVTEEEFKQAFNEVSSEVLEALKEACANIRAFHERQKRNSWMETSETGTILGQLIRDRKSVV